ncbi:MAG: hypothetical protein ACE5KZ_08130 [Candidatus Scalinduaceae bacterium]
MRNNYLRKTNIFQVFLNSCIFSLIMSLAMFGTSNVYSQEENKGSMETETSVNTTNLETGKQVVEQVNVLEGGDMIGRIDWENRVIYSVGDGVMPPDVVSAAQARVRSKRAAIDEAYGRMVEMANEVRVDAESTTRNYINENRVVRTRVSGMVKNAEVEEIKQFEDGSYQVMMKMSMDGAKGLGSVLLPVQMERVRNVRVVSHSKRSAISSAIEPAQESITKKAENYTGLIIDAMGLGAKPAMYPRVLDEKGESVYDVASANPNATIEEGLTGYRKSIDAAKQVARIGNNPLIIKAQKINGKYNADIVVSDSDAQKIFQADSKGGILGEAKVVVVID